jgi:hypothetical protein
VGAIIGKSLSDAPWLGQLEKITTPALVIHGANPNQTPGDGGPRLAGKLPNATLVTIQDAGHDPWLDQPQAFFDAANGFLAQLWTTDVLGHGGSLTATPTPWWSVKHRGNYRLSSFLERRVQG